MNKILPLIVVAILVLGCFGAVGTTNDSERQLYMINETTEISFDDEIDQYQNEVNEGIPVGSFEGSGFPRYNWSVAQSFIPGKEVLTRVKLALSRNTMPPTIFPLVVSIRDDLSGKNLAIDSIEPEDIFEFPEYSLIEFDFDDILVTIGQTYYIVVYTKNVTDNGYVWGVNLEGGYPHGGVHVSWDDGSTWNDDFVAIDTAFVTYGRNNAPPNTPTINGPTSGKAGTEYEYKLKSIDSDDDDITYCIDWGDGTGEICIGPYPSDLEVTASHTWISKGTFTIKVKSMDVLGAESDWATLEVSMPKNKALNIPFLSFLENHPHLFPLLRQLLGRS